MTFFKCFKGKKLEACMKKDLRERFGQFFDDELMTMSRHFMGEDEKRPFGNRDNMFDMLYGFDVGDGADGGGGGGFDMGGVIQMIGGLTNKSGGAGGGSDGFMQLLQGFGGSGGDGTPVGNIVQILLGLAKSYFNIKGKSNASIQDWDSAGAGQNSSDGNFLNWAMSVIRQLLFPGKKPKEIIETGDDDDIDTDPDNGKKKDDGDVKG